MPPATSPKVRLVPLGWFLCLRSPCSLAGWFDAVMVDVASLERVKVYLLSLPQLLPLVVAATGAEQECQDLRLMRNQYSPLYMLSLPLRQV
jgi:hypothetical protein